MKILDYIPKEMKSISIIGLSKNAGKTTLLNTFIQEESNRNTQEIPNERNTLGIVSTGVDGEERDVWSHRPKPHVLVPKGTFIATVGTCLEEKPGDWELKDQCQCHLTMAPLFIARATRDTKAKMMGVTSNAQLKDVLSRFKACGVTRTYVDGSYDRKSAAKPSVTEGVVMVVGGSMDTSLRRIQKKVQEVSRLFGLPQIEKSENTVIQQIEQESCAIIRNQQMETHPPLFFKGEEWMGNIKRDEAVSVYYAGALTDSLIRLCADQKKWIKWIVPDATHVFVSSSILRSFIEKGGKICVVHPIRLLAVAINPTSVEGYAFDPKRMMEEVKKTIPSVPVFNVLRREV